MTPRLYGHHTDVRVRRHHKLSLVVVVAPQVPYHTSNMQCHYLPSKHHPLSLVTLHVLTACPSVCVISYQLLSKYYQLSLVVVALQVPLACPSVRVISYQLLSKHHPLSLVALQVPTTCPSSTIKTSLTVPGNFAGPNSMFIILIHLPKVPSTD